MKNQEVPPLSEQAFHSADKTKVKDGVLAFMRTIKLTSGSITNSDPYRHYDLYTLLDNYVNDAEFRIQANDLMKKAWDRKCRAAQILKAKRE